MTAEAEPGRRDPPPDVEVLARGVQDGDRRSLARAITLVESRRPTDVSAASELLDRVWPHRTEESVRIAVTGPPGAGKSTMIEAIGTRLVDDGRRVAVLAIDPSSGRSGGSILGDKTRMTRLAANANAFVRPSPTSGHLGGVTGSTRAAIALCEAAGYDTVVVETVGVGQSEIDAADITDIVLLLVLAGAGDEIQGVKRGILEIADIVAVNKADAVPEAASDARGLYRSAMALIGSRHKNWRVPVLATSALAGDGLDSVLSALSDLNALLSNTNQKVERRRLQRRIWFDEAVQLALIQRYLSSAEHQTERQRLSDAAERGAVCPASAAMSLLAHKR